MKLAITGKGGVGKTTLTSLLAQQFSNEGKRVIAVDADPDANLASALGFSDIENITPISEMASLIEERTGAKPGASGSFFTINPKVDDLPEKLWLEKGNIRLMVLGTIKKGGSGCICPESALLKSLITHLVTYRNEVVIMDMEAGIEHIGRGTAFSVDRFIVVVEPGRRSIETAQHIEELCGGVGIKKISIVGSKTRGTEDENFVREQLKGRDILGFIPYNKELIDADMKGNQVAFSNTERVEEIIKNMS